jgi:hypothetical protein
VIAPSSLPDRFEHCPGGTANQLAEGPPYLVFAGGGICWKQHYVCDRCGSLFPLFEPLHVAVILPVRLAA